MRIFTKKMLQRPSLMFVSILVGKYLLVDNIEADESDSDDEVMNFLIALEKRGQAPERIKNYIEATVNIFTGKQFQQNFRLTPEAYEIVLRITGPHLNKKTVFGRQRVPVEKQILAVLWLLATPDSYRSVGERFDLAKSTLSVCFMRVVKTLCELAPLIVVWPTENEKINIKHTFKHMGNLPHIVGAIDGTFVDIKAPKQDSEVYITRKCSYSIILQAISRPDLKFIDVYVGYPGSVSDNRVFRNSDIFASIQNRKEDYLSGEEYIIGDKAYPNLDWCITPYINRGNMTPSKIHFNNHHAKTRQTIERCFALLFGRFRRLKYLDMNRTDIIPATVLASCILHNICRNIEFDEQFINDGLLTLGAIRDNREDDNEVNNLYQENLRLGQQKRDQLCQELYGNRNRNNIL